LDTIGELTGGLAEGYGGETSLRLGEEHGHTRSLVGRPEYRVKRLSGHDSREGTREGEAQGSSLVSKSLGFPTHTNRDEVERKKVRRKGSYSAGVWEVH